MGRGFTQYTYPNDGLPDEYAVYSAFLDYVFHDGTRLPVTQADCYCPNCGRIGIAEHLETVAQLQDRLEQLMIPDSMERYLAEGFGSVSAAIAELQKRIDWRKSRQSPAKCLRCGSTKILLLPDDDEFDHPATGLRMKNVAHGFASTFEWHATYTPEGDVIESSG